MYKLITVTETPTTIPERNKEEYGSLNKALRIAGSRFHDDNVQSVCVVHESGYVWMYLNKVRSRLVWIFPPRTS
jgi:hypothetical protein